MKITRDFRPLTDRYAFDTGPCSYANGFAQIDTRQDASYYGTWCSPVARTIVSFCDSRAARGARGSPSCARPAPSMARPTRLEVLHQRRMP